jgi:flavoprotein
MKRAMVNPDKCKYCETCAIEENCLSKAVIREEKKDMPWIDFYKCRGCMKCKQFCLYDAVLEEIKPCNGNLLETW